MPEAAFLSGFFASLLKAITSEGPPPAGTKMLPEYPGQSLDVDDFAASPIGRENFSRLVDSVPAVADQFLATGLNVSQVWRQVLQGARVAKGAISDEARESEQALFQAAFRDFEIGALASSIDPLGPRFHPSHPQPPSWATSSDGWTDFTFDYASEDVSETTAPLKFEAPLIWNLANEIPPELRQVRPSGVLRMADHAELAAIDQQPELPVVVEEVEAAPGPVPTTVLARAGMHSTLAARAIASSLAAPEAAAPSRRALAVAARTKDLLGAETAADLTQKVSLPRLVRIASRPMGMQALPITADEERLVTPLETPDPEVQVTDADFGRVLIRARIADSLLHPQPVDQSTSSTVKISFSYMRIGIIRTWLDLSLLTLGGWFLPGRAKGSLSDGADSAAPGLLKYLPTSLIVIRNLDITARWSQADKQRIESGLTVSFPSAFGPFRFSSDSASFDGVSLQSEGPQILSWLAQRTPLAPPLDTPA
jgi:hypothetical protein